MNSRYNLRSLQKKQQPPIPVVPVQIPPPPLAPLSRPSSPPPPRPPVSPQLYISKPPVILQPPPVCPNEASLLDNWHWNLYQTIGLTVESSQHEVDHVLRHTLRKYHPDKTPGKERVYARVDFIYKTLGAKAARYRKLLSGTYVPHGGGLLDEKAMAAYLSGKKPNYTPERLACVLPETGPRFTPRVKSDKNHTESIVSSWRVYGSK